MAQETYIIHWERISDWKHSVFVQSWHWWCCMVFGSRGLSTRRERNPPVPRVYREIVHFSSSQCRLFPSKLGDNIKSGLRICTRGKEGAWKWEQLTTGKVFFFPRFYYALNSDWKLIMETAAPYVREGRPRRRVMRSGLQLRLIFQCPGQLAPLRALSRVHVMGLASRKRVDVDVASDFRIPLLMAW